MKTRVLVLGLILILFVGVAFAEKHQHNEGVIPLKHALSYRFFYNDDGLGNITRQVLKNSFSDDYYPQLIKLILDIRPEN